MVTPLEQVISSVAVVVQLPSVHLLVFWIVLHGPKLKNNFEFIQINNQFNILSSYLIDLACTFCSHDTKKTNFRWNWDNEIKFPSVHFWSFANLMISISSKVFIHRTKRYRHIGPSDYLFDCKITNQTLKIQDIHMPNMLLND